MLLMLIGWCFYEIITFVSSGGFLHFTSESAMPEAQGIFVVAIPPQSSAMLTKR